MRAFLRQFLDALTHSGPGYQPTPLPARGDHVEAWLKAQRNRHADGFTRDPQWETLDDLLDQYRLHADTGTPLGEHVCESNRCDCLEVAR